MTRVTEPSGSVPHEVVDADDGPAVAYLARMNAIKALRAALVGVGVGGVLVATAACGGKGACVQTFDDGKTFLCSETTQSVCSQGKGDKWVGGTCKDAGYTKKIGKTGDSWEK